MTRQSPAELFALTGHLIARMSLYSMIGSCFVGALAGDEVRRFRATG